MRSCQSIRSWVKSMSWVAHCWRSHRLVELRVAEQVDLAAVRGLQHRGIARGLEVLALGPLDDGFAHGVSLPRWLDLGGRLAVAAYRKVWLASQFRGRRRRPRRPPRAQGPGSAVASIRTRPGARSAPTSASPGRRPSIVVETEPRPPPTVIVLPPKRQPVLAAVLASAAPPGSTMNAGTRTTRGRDAAAAAVNSASVRAGSSSPAPPGWSSGAGRRARSPSRARWLRLGLGLGGLRLRGRRCRSSRVVEGRGSRLPRRPRRTRRPPAQAQ